MDSHTESQGQIQVVFLAQTGEIKQGKIKGVTPEILGSSLKKKSPPVLLGRYTWNAKQRTLFLFGYVEGKVGTENQHHLLAPLEGVTYFGDILVLCSPVSTSYSNPVNLKTSDYETFYTNKLEGEDDDEDNDMLSEEEAAASAEIELNEEEEYEENINPEEIAEEEENANASDTEADAEDEEEVVLEKPTRVSRKKAAPVEEPEMEFASSTRNDPIRKRVYEIINKIFGPSLNEAYMSDEEKDAFESILFRHSYEYATKNDVKRAWSNQAFVDIYLATSKRLIGNLSPTSYVGNKNLWERYVSKELSLEQIVKQNYYELCPENWQSMVDRQAKREQIQLDGDFSRATDKWLCNRCGKKKCTTYELQTRSADEPMTIFIHCLNCGKRWTH